jgi:hypothetical protein
MMNKVSTILFSTLTLFTLQLTAAANQRRYSYPQSRHQASSEAHSRRHLRSHWLKKKDTNFESIQELLDKNGLSKVNGKFIYSRRALMCVLAERRLR